MEEKNWEKLALTGSPDIVIVVDQEGSILYINHVLPGFTLDKVIGTSVNNYIPPAYHEAYKEALAEVFKGQTKEFIVTGAGADGKTAWYLTRIGPISENGQTIAATVVSTDITARMDSDDDLKAAKLEVERLSTQVKELQNK
jgi:PAS domain S-box-containing protein